MIKIKVPPNIVIGGINYDVYFLKEMIKNDMDDELVARIQYIDPKIQIYEGIGEQLIDISFIHEVTHGILYCMGIVGEPEVKLDERYVEQFTHILYQVMQQIIEFNKK